MAAGAVPRVVQGEPFETPGKPNKSQRTQAEECIDSKKLDVDAVFGPAGTIVKEETVRLDKQGQTHDGGSNLQIQLNVRGKSTISTTLVSGDLVKADPQALIDSVRQALRDSLNSNGKPGDSKAYIFLVVPQK